MKETFFFFDSRGRKLFGALALPSKDSGRGVVVCAPITDEKMRSYRVMRNFAAYLARNGYAVFRFDYMGEGDSDGRFEDSSIETRLMNVSDAIMEFRNKYHLEEISLLGLRFGATLALMHASRNGGVDNMILWQPVVDCHAYFYDGLRANLTLQTREHKKILFNREQLIGKMKQGESINIEGHLWGWDLYRQGTSIDLIKETDGLAVNSLIVQIARGDSIQRDQMALHERLKANGRRHAIMTTGKEFQWEDMKFYNPHPITLFEKTLGWMKNA